MFDLRYHSNDSPHQKYSRKFTATKRYEPLDFPINHLLELPIRNNSLKQIKDLRGEVLNFFRNSLWLADQKPNDKLVIVYIVPDRSDPNVFLMGVGSYYPEPFKMSRTLASARTRGFGDGWEELDFFRENIKLNAEFWNSKSFEFHTPQPASPVYELLKVNITYRATLYNDGEKEEIELKKVLLARSKAGTGLITGSLVAFAFLSFVVSHLFWISIIFLSMLVTTCLTIAFVYFHNNKM